MKIEFKDYETVEELLEAVEEWVKEAREAHREGKPLPEPKHGGGGGP